MKLGAFLIVILQGPELAFLNFGPGFYSSS